MRTLFLNCYTETLKFTPINLKTQKLASKYLQNSEIFDYTTQRYIFLGRVLNDIDTATRKRTYGYP